MVSVAVMAVVAFGENHLQVVLFAFAYWCTWLLIQRGPVLRQKYVQCS